MTVEGLDASGALLDRSRMMSAAVRIPPRRRMRAVPWSIVLALLVLLMPGSAVAQGQAQVERPPLRFAPVAFTDPMAGGVEAITLLVPTGWQASGGVEWLPAWSRAAALHTYVSDPASGLTIAWLPVQDFLWFPEPAGFQVPAGANYQGKAYVRPIRDPERFVRRFWMPTVLGHLDGATVVGRREVPILADAFLRGFGGPADAGAWTLRYAFERDGRPWEQDVTFSLLWSEANGITSWYVNLAHTVAGPAGSLDAQVGTISAVVASRQTTPAWEAVYRQVQRLFYQGIQQQMADTVRFGEALARYRAEIQQLQAQVTAERWASQDRIAQERRDILGGVDNYVDPFDGRIVQLPSGWTRYWVNPQGEVLASDDAAFDPSASGGGWQQLQPRADAGARVSPGSAAGAGRS